MCSGMTFNINLKELEEEFTTFRYALDDSFLESFPSSDIKKGKLNCQLTIRTTDTFYEFDFHIDGTVAVPCDRCLEDMDQSITADNKLIVKLGEEYSEDEELITLDEEDAILDVSWFIYEFITLSLPIRHVHPDGKCNTDMIKYITAEDDVIGEGAEDSDKPVDPRWNKLSELLEKN